MTERKRATGFVLIDAAFAADRKFVRLARLAPSPADYAAAVGVFCLILADARRVKSPAVDFEEWAEYTDQVALLREVRLLTEDGCDPTTFDKWAPAYRSPWDTEWVRSGTARVRKGTDTSVQFNSGNGVGGVGEGEPQNFMRFPPKREPGLLADAYRHEGQHANCDVCATVKGPA